MISASGWPVLTGNNSFLIFQYPTPYSAHDREADGGDTEGTAIVGGIAATDGGGDEVDQAAKRVTSALELMQTLVSLNVVSF